MKKLLIVGVLFPLFAAPAFGEGAIAIAVGEGGPKNGYAYTMNVRNSTADGAQNEALKGCRQQATVYGVSPDRCRVVASFRRQCAAVAFDAQERAAGWDLGETREDAIANAVKKCGADGARNCKPHNVECDQ